MKNLLYGLITAFSMYSTIPMPMIEWNKNTMKYALCFFPFVGGIIGLCIYFFNMLSLNFEFSFLFYSGAMVLIPLLLSGAIHLDGFMDTSDARYSRQDTEKKLMILKDPHIGAFGVIMCVGIIVLQFSLYGQLFILKNNIIILALGFILSRSLSALSIASFKTAKNTGLAYIFADNAQKKTVKICMVIYILILFILMIIINILIGSIIGIGAILGFLIYKRMCYKEFNGITGDLAGYFLILFETFILALCAFL